MVRCKICCRAMVRCKIPVCCRAMVRCKICCRAMVRCNIYFAGLWWGPGGGWYPWQLRGRSHHDPRSLLRSRPDKVHQGITRAILSTYVYWYTGTYLLNLREIKFFVIFFLERLRWILCRSMRRIFYWLGWGWGSREQGAGKEVPVWPKTSFDNTRYLFSINFSIC